MKDTLDNSTLIDCHTYNATFNQCELWNGQNQGAAEPTFEDISDYTVLNEWNSRYLESRTKGTRAENSQRPTTDASYGPRIVEVDDQGYEIRGDRSCV
jgi:hypothetical protein